MEYPLNYRYLIIIYFILEKIYQNYYEQQIFVESENNTILRLKK